MGCFHWLARFAPARIARWVDLVDGAVVTALCPSCGVDAALGDASAFPIESAFLAAMRQRWFG